jgi:hypothetical protein
MTTLQRAILLLLICAPMTNSALAADPATQPADLNTLKADALADIAKEMLRLPSLGPRNLSDLVTFTMQDGKFFPLTNLPITGTNFHRLTLTGLPGVGKVQVLSDETLHQAAGQKFLQFFYRDWTMPNAVVAYTDILSNLASVQVSREIEFPGDQILSVSVVQSAQPTPDAVTVYIQSPQSTPGPSNMLKLTGPTVEQLSVDHPAEINTYVRPIFRLLHQEQTVFDPDPKLANQVLAEYHKDDSATIAATNRFVAQLAADAFPQRETALSALRTLGEPAALYLLHTPPHGLTPEQSMRVELFLAPYRPLSNDDVKRMKANVNFLLDCQYSPDESLRAAALLQLNRVAGRMIDLPANLSGDQLILAVTNLRDSLTTPAMQP